MPSFPRAPCSASNPPASASTCAGAASHALLDAFPGDGVHHVVQDARGYAGDRT
jgi:hypothetical protein